MELNEEKRSIVDIIDNNIHSAITLYFDSTMCVCEGMVPVVVTVEEWIARAKSSVATSHRDQNRLRIATKRQCGVAKYCNAR